MRAVTEVAQHLIETGETYLPGTANTVLVEYTIADDDAAEAEFRQWRSGADLAPGAPPGFVGETLYRVRWDGEPEDAKRRFINIGHWLHRSAFDEKFGARADRQPGREDWEDGPRRRGWLERDD